jgi:dolichol-phosphate mannosyltransferase
MFGITTNNLMKNIWWAKKAIFSFSVKPLEYIQRMGFILFVVSIVLSFGYLINYYWSPQTRARGVTTMVLLILGLGGVQLFSLSILGDYLGKILEEVKNRPRFIRSRIFTAQEVIESRDGLEKFVRQAKEISHGKYR